jgi:hypothetical protein
LGTFRKGAQTYKYHQRGGRFGEGVTNYINITEQGSDREKGAQIMLMSLNVGRLVDGAQIAFISLKRGLFGNERGQITQISLNRR